MQALDPELPEKSQMASQYANLGSNLRTYDAVGFVHLMNQVKNLVDSRSHTQARILVAEYYELHTHIKKFNLILELQNLDGKLDKNLAHYRESATYDMMLIIHRYATKKEYRELAKEL